MYAQQCVQPTGTNRPRAWGSCSLWKARGVVGNNCLERERRRSPCVTHSRFERKVSGDHSGRVTPVPIPNTEVKPASADGTWGRLPGRVGRRRNSSQTNAHPQSAGGHCRAQKATWRYRHARGQSARCPCTTSRPGLRPADQVREGAWPARVSATQFTGGGAARVRARATRSQEGRGRRAAGRCAR